MKLLLDTQVFIWLSSGSNKIGTNTHKLLEDVSNQIYLSYFSCFEMTIKASVGKLDYDPSIIDDLPRMGIELIMPTPRTLRNYETYNPNNKDPFDNALISVALDENTALLTSDEKILSTQTPDLKSLDAKR